MGASDLTANIPCIHFVHYVSERSKLIFAVITVHTVIHSYKSDISVRKVGIGVISYLQIISAESGHIFYYNCTDISHFNILKQFLKAGAVKICSCVTVINIKSGIAETVFLCILRKHTLLERDLSRVFYHSATN